MNITLDVPNRGDGGSTPSIGLIPDVLPKAKSVNTDKCSYTGVSTHSIPLRIETVSGAEEHWYALRTTYGREKKAYDYIIAHGGQAFLPTITIEKTIRGKRRKVVVSRIPNIFFAYGTEEYIKSFVYDNHNLSYLRFYYKSTHSGGRIEKTPLIVPTRQIFALKIICDQEQDKDILLFNKLIQKFKEGDRVRVIEGDFKGVEGVIARYQGQQRVGVVIENIITAITAYIPTAFIVKEGV